MTRGRI
jgi:hypothetical protein